MIGCLLNKFAVRRQFDHGDHGAKLSARAQEHLAQCPACRAAYENEVALTNRFAAQRPAATEPPPFLRARIVNAVRQTKRESSAPNYRWVAATAGVALLVAFVATHLEPQPKPERTFNIAFNADFLEAENLLEAAKFEKLSNPLQTEIEALKNDTKKAAKALAACFSPTTSP